jgi:hypothetical protein
LAVTSHGVALATAAWHLVLPTVTTDKPVLYAKPDDYFEACDVADRGSGVAEELAAVAGLAVSDRRAVWTTPLSARALSGM